MPTSTMYECGVASAARAGKAVLSARIRIAGRLINFLVMKRDPFARTCGICSGHRSQKTPAVCQETIHGKVANVQSSGKRQDRESLQEDGRRTTTSYSAQS